MSTSIQQGFSIIGVLIATFIISLVGISASQLLTRSERIAEVATGEFVASNLAREGLELVRIMRDNNWFAAGKIETEDEDTQEEQAEDDGADVGEEENTDEENGELEDETESETVEEEEDTEEVPPRSDWITENMCGEFTYDTAMARAGDLPQGSGGAELFLNEESGEWGHGTSGGEPTSFSRVIEVDCSQKDADPAFVTVTSTVQWNVRGDERSVVLKEKLYNWLP